VGCRAAAGELLGRRRAAYVFGYDAYADAYSKKLRRRDPGICHQLRISAFPLYRSYGRTAPTSLLHLPPDGRLLYSLEASDGSPRFYHFDEAGSTLFLTGDDGSITDSYAITPYGEQVDHTGPSDNPFTFSGNMVWRRRARPGCIIWAFALRQA